MKGLTIVSNGCMKWQLELGGATVPNHHFFWWFRVSFAKLCEGHIFL
jgi:hypothetical protein